MQRVNVTELRCPHLLGDLLLPWTAHTGAPIGASPPPWWEGGKGAAHPLVSSVRLLSVDFR